MGCYTVKIGFNWLVVTPLKCCSGCHGDLGLRWVSMEAAHIASRSDSTHTSTVALIAMQCMQI